MSLRRNIFVILTSFGLMATVSCKKALEETTALCEESQSASLTGVESRKDAVGGCAASSPVVRTVNDETSSISVSSVSDPNAGNIIKFSAVHRAGDRYLSVREHYAVDFEHNGDYVECSYDGGLEFQQCTTESSYRWAAGQDYATHVIRVWKEGAVNSPFIYDFKPAGLYKNIKGFVECTQYVEKNEDFSTFAYRLRDGKQVICISDGVIIYNDDSTRQDPIRVSSNNNIIIVRSGENAGLINTATSGAAPVIEITGYNNAIVGLDILNDNGDGIYGTGDTTRLVHVKVDVDNGDGLVVEEGVGLELRNSSIRTTALQGAGITVAADAVISTVVGTQIEAAGEQSVAIKLAGASLNEVRDSTITSVNQILVADDSTSWSAAIHDTEIHCESASLNPCIDLLSANAGGKLLMRGNDLIVYNDSIGINLYGANKIDDFVLMLAQNRFIRLDQGEEDKAAIAVDGPILDSEIITSMNEENIFCKAAGGQRDFAPILALNVAQTFFDLPGSTSDCE